jgi:hypothetical protein
MQSTCHAGGRTPPSHSRGRRLNAAREAEISRPIRPLTGYFWRALKAARFGRAARRAAAPREQPLPSPPGSWCVYYYTSLDQGDDRRIDFKVGARARVALHLHAHGTSSLRFPSTPLAACRGAAVGGLPSIPSGQRHGLPGYSSRIHIRIHSRAGATAERWRSRWTGRRRGMDDGPNLPPGRWNGMKPVDRLPSRNLAQLGMANVSDQFEIKARTAHAPRQWLADKSPSAAPRPPPGPQFGSARYDSRAVAKPPARRI